jgi:DNA-binding HxlR family transcriptional regulator
MNVKVTSANDTFKIIVLKPLVCYPFTAFISRITSMSFQLTLQAKYVLVYAYSLDVWGTRGRKFNYHELQDKLAISSSMLSKAIGELEHEKLLSRTRKYQNGRTHYEYALTGLALVWMAIKNIFGNPLVKSSAQMIISCIQPFRDSKSTSRALTIQTRLLLITLVSNLKRKSPTVELSNHKLQKVLSISSSRLSHAINELIELEILSWHLPGFKSRIFFGTKTGLFKLDVNYLEKVFMSAGSDINSFIGQRIFTKTIQSRTLLNVDQLFSQSYANSEDLTELHRRTASDLKKLTPDNFILWDLGRAPQIVDHLKLMIVQHAKEDLDARVSNLDSHATKRNIPGVPEFLSEQSWMLKSLSPQSYSSPTRAPSNFIFLAERFESLINKILLEINSAIHKHQSEWAEHFKAGSNIRHLCYPMFDDRGSIEIDLRQI